MNIRLLKNFLIKNKKTFAIKNNQIKFSEVKNKQNEFLDKLTNIKIDKKNWQTRSD